MEVQPVALYVTHTQPQQFAGAQAGHNGYPVGMDILVLLHFSTHHTGVCGEQHPQGVRLQDLLAFIPGTFWHSQTLVLWPQCCIFMLAGPLDKGHLHAPDALQRLAGQVSLAPAPAGLVQTPLFVGAVQHILQHTGAQITDTPHPDHRQDVVAAKLLHLVYVAAARCGLDRDHVLGPHVSAALCGAGDAFIQPSVRFAVCFSLAGAAGLGTGKCPAHTIFLHLDLPALLVWQPCGCIGSLSHVYTSKRV